ncbi:hypothetical protein CAL7716_085800 [Calothrix sp. PCC 7716]|nr:hypothetical protein CAL7716_085800 [Calothrix sp. PCC 7716]
MNNQVWEELINVMDEGYIHQILWNPHEKVYLYKRYFGNEVSIQDITVLKNKNEAILRAAETYTKEKPKREK